MQEYQEEPNNFMPEMATPAPKKKEMKRSASASTTHKKKSSINKHQGTISIDGVGSG